MQAEIQAIQTKVQECIARAEQAFGIKMPHVQVRFDLTGRAAGMAGYTRRMDGLYFYLRFNIKHMQLGGKTWEHLLMDTVPHEVAHTVCQAFPQYGRNHDQGWQRVCRALGGNGRRTYSEDDAPEAIAALRPWVYITTAGHQVRVTKTIHSKIQHRHASYSYKGGRGTINRQCQYSYMSAPAQAAARKPLVVAQPAQHPAAVAVPTVRPAATAQPAAKGNNAQLVRARIAQAKAAAEGSSVVVNYAVSQLGMTLALAKTYVKNNWSKV